MSLSEVLEPTVAELQGREAGGSRRQNRDCRNTNWQRGRVCAASMLGNAKPEVQPGTSSRARQRARKVKILTRGDLDRESGQGVSRGRSSEEAGEQVSRWSEGPKEPRQTAKVSWWIWRAKTLGTRDVTTTVITPDRQGGEQSKDGRQAQPGRVKSGPPRQHRRKGCQWKH